MNNYSAKKRCFLLLRFLSRILNIVKICDILINNTRTEFATARENSAVTVRLAGRFSGTFPEHMEARGDISTAQEVYPVIFR